MWRSFGIISLLMCVLATALGSPNTNITSPVDWRHRVASKDFQETGPGQWTSPLLQPPFAFDELIYSWHQSAGDTFRLFLQVSFGKMDESDWLYAGFWGAVTNGITNRQRPTFDRGVVDMDWLKLTSKAMAFRFRVVASGTNALLAPPALTVVATDKTPATNLLRANAALPGRVLDVPLRRQMNAEGVWMKDRCQSAALASALQYYGKTNLLEDIVRHTNDPEYNYPGLWPRVIAAAREFGFDGYIERFRDWESVRKALAENKMILCSMRLKAGEASAPPYASIGNHIVVLNGATDDGRVVVTDSALGKSGQGYLCQWLLKDFEHVWMRTKGGVAMVICPPPDVLPKLVTNLPPFPSRREFPSSDDH